ncbi:MAG: Hsp20/alpha crystallin family protein [Thiogranum sp.]|nr:Hsp20/alpha crystallin family protein [Thiogranum sp.]
MFDVLSVFDDSRFDEFRRMQRELDETFNAPFARSIRSVATGTYPPVNVGSTPDELDVYVFAAGVDPKSLDISVQQNVLSISGERKPIQEDGAKYYRHERFDGAFRRVVTLPDDADPEQVDATYRDGVLRISVKRRESARPRQIEVK